MKIILNIIRLIRAKFNRTILPNQMYWTATKTIEPISTKFGYDRGTPIDRFWIEKFIDSNKENIKGVCLEITDNSYTLKYGGSQVTRSDVLDVDTNNKNANIYGDLRNLKDVISDNTYDCIVLTHVLGLIDDINNAISECYRILKPGGVILATSSCLSPNYDNSNYWRFTAQGAKYLFNKHFNEELINIISYGNVLTGQCFWVGMAQEDLTPKQLEYNDPKYPCVVAIKAIKESQLNG